ncbi:MAG TPA: cell division topological specificity factor MinE [Gammaproteobacteria bacterium]|nr:cell division topological specificity factor MinE [Gammaproteobacteria bacterium]
MSLIDYLKTRLNRPNTAQIAKERLQIIVAHERIQRKNGVVDLQQLQQKLITVIAEYLHIDKNQVNVELQRDANRSVLELNVTLPDQS